MPKMYINPKIQENVINLVSKLMAYSYHTRAKYVQGIMVNYCVVLIFARLFTNTNIAQDFSGHQLWAWNKVQTDALPNV